MYNKATQLNVYDQQHTRLTPTDDNLYTDQALAKSNVRINTLSFKQDNQALSSAFFMPMIIMAGCMGVSSDTPFSCLSGSVNSVHPAAHSCNTFCRGRLSRYRGVIMFGVFLHRFLQLLLKSPPHRTTRLRYLDNLER